MDVITEEQVEYNTTCSSSSVSTEEKVVLDPVFTSTPTKIKSDEVNIGLKEMEPGQLKKDDTDTKKDMPKLLEKKQQNGNTGKIYRQDHVQHVLNSRLNSKSTMDVSQNESTTITSKINRAFSHDALSSASKLKTSSSLDYNYLVIASPSVRRRVQDPLISASSSSFISNSSCDTTPSVTSVSKRSPKSKAVLEAVKRRLQNEVSSIDQEIATMEAEKLVLLNLRNAIINFRNSVIHSERNKQGLLVAEKVKSVMNDIAKSIQNEELAVLNDYLIPHVDELKKELAELSRLCHNIIDYKPCVHLTCVEEFFGAAGKLFGVIECLLLLYYEDENEDMHSLNGWESKNSSLCSDDLKNCSIRNSMEDFLQNDSRQIPTSDQTDGEKERGKNEQTCSKQFLKAFVKKINKAKKIFNTVERLSSGAPKIKILCKIFKEIRNILGEETFSCGRDGTVIQEMNENIEIMQRVLKTDRPGQRELEQSIMVMGELSGRAKILMRSELVDM